MMNYVTAVTFKKNSLNILREIAKQYEDTDSLKEFDLCEEILKKMISLNKKEIYLKNFLFEHFNERSTTEFYFLLASLIESIKLEDNGIVLVYHYDDNVKAHVESFIEDTNLSEIIINVKKYSYSDIYINTDVSL